MKKSILLLIALVALLSFGCPIPDDPNSSHNSQTSVSLNVSASSLVFTEAGSSQLVAISGDADWVAVSNQSWCGVFPAQGSGNGAITVVVQLNDTVVQRTAKITVSAVGGGLSREIVITQAAGQPSVPVVDPHGNSINTSSAALAFTASAGSKSLQITANVSWQITSDQSWCSVSVSTGTNDGSVNVSVGANESVSSRTATLSISNSGFGLTKTVVVTQSGVDPSIDASPAALDFTASGGGKSLQITANVSWQISSDQSWCSVSASSGTGNSSINVSTSANETYSSRTATLSISNSEFGLNKKVVVTQSGLDPSSVIIYVAPTGNDSNDGKSWAKAVKNISTGIYFAPAGGQVWVAEGAYSETVVMKDGVNVFGGFNQTESSISDRGTRRSTLPAGSAFSMIGNFTLPTIIDGFTLNATQTIPKNVTMNNCGITTGFAYINGGTAITDYSFYVSGGVVSNSTITIDNNNRGTFSIDTGGIVSNCHFTVTAVNRTGISLNSGRMEGCLVTGQAGGYVGTSIILQYSGGDNYTVNCTFYDITEYAPPAAGYFLGGSGVMYFVNNIVLPGLPNSSTAGLYDGNNLEGLPTTAVYFLNADLSPMSYSPAVNAGNNSYVTIDKDILGNPRIQGGKVDIGAIESPY